MKPTVIHLIEEGPILATRKAGAKLADKVARQLRRPPGVILNFTGVEIVTPSFLDEVLMRARGVLASHEAGLFVLAGLSEEVNETVALVLAHRNLAVGELKKNQVSLLGGNKQLQETLAEAHRLKEFTAAQLAEKLEKKLPNVHHRLNALVEAGALCKERDDSAVRGKRWKYAAVTEAEDPVPV